MGESTGVLPRVTQSTTGKPPESVALGVRAGGLVRAARDGGGLLEASIARGLGRKLVAGRDRRRAGGGGGVTANGVGVGTGGGGVTRGARFFGDRRWGSGGARRAG